MQDSNPVDAENTASEETQTNSVNSNNLNGADKEGTVEAKTEAKKEDGCNKDCEKRIMVLLAILMVLILSFGAIFAFQYFNEEEVIPPVVEEDVNDEVVEEETNNPVNEPADEAGAWKTYENDEYGISLSYPSDWELEEIKYDLPSNPITIKISDKNSFFYYTQPLLEAMYCYYGTSVEEGVGGYSFSSKFEEFNNSSFIIRRSMFEGDYFMINEEGEKYGICKQDNEDYIYGVFEGFVYYNIDENATNKEELLETMDAIFLTMEG